LQPVYVDLLHLKHRLHDPRRFLRILIAQQLAEYGGNDLPGEAELVLEPAALVDSAARRELVPQFVDLLLVLAAHEQGDGGSKLVLRAAVQRVEVLSLELKSRGHDRAFRPWSRRAIPRDPSDL